MEVAASNVLGNSNGGYAGGHGRSPPKKAVIIDDDMRRRFEKEKQIRLQAARRRRCNFNRPFFHILVLIYNVCRQQKIREEATASEEKKARDDALKLRAHKKKEYIKYLKKNLKSTQGLSTKYGEQGGKAHNPSDLFDDY